ncbi:hypothetical protein VPNG_05372 [Cytospora leucostoma]|uniref:Uncharacterized protein n=1 Tax=Cytospora leucostoma TaxID=1230097 RepID=A0A423X486_9PEZI|nr:hypothetical protein VPNG_05372 [Cytospora leucostoma]
MTTMTTTKNGGDGSESPDMFPKLLAGVPEVRCDGEAGVVAMFPGDLQRAGEQDKMDEEQG